WGLLSTPQWIPELSVSIGLCIYALSLLLDIYRLKPPANNGRRWAAPVFALAMAATLCLLGRLPMSIAGGRMDWGSVVIVVFLLASMLAWSGLKATLQVSAIMGVMALLFWLA